MYSLFPVLALLATANAAAIDRSGAALDKKALFPCVFNCGPTTTATTAAVVTTTKAANSTTAAIPVVSPVVSVAVSILECPLGVLFEGACKSTSTAAATTTAKTTAAATTAAATTTAAGGIIASVINPIASAASSVVAPVVNPVASAASGVVAPIVNPVASAASSVIAPVASAASSAVAPVVSAASSVVAPVASAASSVVAPVASVAASVIAPVASAASSVVAPAASAAASVVAPVGSAAASVVAPVASAAASVVAPVASAAGSVVAPVASAAASVVAPVASAAVSVVAPVASAASSVVAPVVSAASSVVAPVASSVSSIIASVTASSAAASSSAVTTTSTSTAPAVSATPVNPSVSGWAYQAVVAEGTNGRALTGSSYAGSGMTVESCLAFCDNAGYPLAGLEYSSECYCGSTLSNGASLTKTANGGMACSGNANEACGGSSALSLYRSTKNGGSLNGDLTSAAVTLPAGWSSTTCMQEVSGRAFTKKSLVADDMTIQKCLSFCGDSKYAGLEYGTECYCADVLSNGASLTSTSGQCTTPCGGAKSATCGGPNAVQVYTNANKATPVGATNTQCFQEVDGRLLRGASIASDNMTTETCTSFCKSQGFTIAGLEYGRECYCDNTYFSTPLQSGQCNMNCAGNAKENCGGPNALNIFTL